MFHAFGDSITYGLGASSPALGWVRRLDPVNHGVSGAQAADLANLVLATTPTAADRFIVAVGSNDVYKYGTNLAKQAYFRQCLTALLAWLSLPIKTPARNLTRFGPWHDAMVNNHGLACGTNGNKLTGVVTGSQLVVAYTIQDHALTVGCADVFVGGVRVGQISCTGLGMTTHLGQTYAAAASIFATGLQAGESATVEIEVVSPSGKYFFVDWIASGEQPRPQICVGNVTPWSASAYADCQLTAQVTADYNAIIAAVVADFPNAALVDNHQVITPAQHLRPDGVHPNDAGYALLADQFRAALRL